MRQGQILIHDATFDGIHFDIIENKVLEKINSIYEHTSVLTYSNAAALSLEILYEKFKTLSGKEKVNWIEKNWGTLTNEVTVNNKAVSVGIIFYIIQLSMDKNFFSQFQLNPFLVNINSFLLTLQG